MKKRASWARRATALKAVAVVAKEAEMSKDEAEKIVRGHCRRHHILIIAPPPHPSLNTIVIV